MSAIREFYVGYLPEAPPKLGRRTRRVALLLVLACAALAALLAATHRRLDVATFEFGDPRVFRGTVVERPIPLLVVRRPGVADAASRASRYLLVAPGKVGAARLVEGWDKKLVELSGTLVYRGGRTMIELVPHQIHELVPEEAADEALQAGELGSEQRLGTRTLTGEIVDTKCFLGVMNPGHRKPHRACATRCISGGIPPMLRARDRDGRPLDVLLVGPAGESLNEDVLPFVAEPVEVTGELARTGDLLVLYASVGDIRRL